MVIPWREFLCHDQNRIAFGKILKPFNKAILITYFI